MPEKEPVEEQLPISNFRLASEKTVKKGSGIIVDGESGCTVKYAKCCSPLPGDEVIGFATKGFGISIHKADCVNIIRAKENPENVGRFVDARWELPYESEEEKSLYEAILQIVIHDEIGALAKISLLLADMKVSIIGISSHKRARSELVDIRLTVACKNVAHFQSIVNRLRSIKAIESVMRA